MKRILIAFLLALCAFGAMAGDMIATDGRNLVRLTGKPCENPAVLARLSEGESMQQAHALVNGQAFHPCWSLAAPYVELTYEDGDRGLVRMTSFKPAPDA